MGVCHLSVLLLLLAAFTSAQNGPTYFITSPNVFRLGVEETVSVTVFNVNNPVTVKLYLQDYPNREKIFSEKQRQFTKDQPQSVAMKMNVEDLPKRQPHQEVVTKQYVYLVAKSDDPALTFQKEQLILVSFKSGYVFIQTDKPIYTPGQDVKMRILPLGQNMRPSEDSVQLDIVNPQGTTVERRQDVKTETGIIVEIFEFPLYPLFGNWSAVVSYGPMVDRSFGPEYSLNATVQFEVREYVLPTFSINISAPQYILPQSEFIEVNIKAQYVYGKPVSGSLFFRFGLWEGPNRVNIVKLQESGLQEGYGYSQFNTAELGENWFEENEGKRLYIEASVTEYATGLIENMTDNSAIFARSPYRLKFDKTVKHFKPSLPYTVKIDVFYINNKPAENIPVLLNAEATTARGNVNLISLDGVNVNYTSNSNGETKIVLDIPSDAQTVRIIAKTKDAAILEEQNREAIFEARPYQSPSSSYILIKEPQQEIKVNENLQVTVIVTKNEDISRINFMVVTRGKITHQSTIIRLAGVITTLTFLVTAEMSPSSRIIVYYINEENEVVADAVWLDIEDVCEHQLRVDSDNDDWQRQKPGDQATIKVEGAARTRVGLLAVDKAVYLLNDANRLTSKKMFQSMDKFDLGCGPGGGRDSRGVFENTGLMVITNADIDMDKREAYDCGLAAGKRKRRDISVLTDSYEGEERDYCLLGQERSPDDATCDERTEQLINDLQTTGADARIVAFRHCCEQVFESDGRGRSGGLEAEWVDFEGIKETEDEIQVRSDFPETWIFEEHELDESGSFSLDVTVPSSLTTWIIQAFGISRDYGMCVATPAEMVVFKNFFVALNMPYSVVRGEQIEIRAAVFNYGDYDTAVRVYLQGVEGLCAGARPGERSERKEFIVKKNDATSVSFPVIPTKLGEIPIRIIAFNMAGGDIVEKMLNVVPEGQEQTFVHSIFLDPSGQMCEQGNAACGNDSIINNDGLIQHDEVRNKINQKQINVLDVRLPADVIPGSEKCSVSVIGSLMGPTVKSVIDGGSLHSLLRHPTGCGEQTLIGLAPDIYVLLYLTRTNQVDTATEEKAFKFIRDGYNNELTYRNESSGCFSVFRDIPCSTWLTAFAMKIFCQAKELIYIDQQNVICPASSWLLTMQKDDGSFKENYHVIHKEMTGGVHGDASFTAFVLISLLECDCNTEEMNTAITDAVAYLENQVDNLQRPYSVAIVAYALALANSARRVDANNRLKALAVFDEAKNVRYWNTDDSSLADNNRPFWYRHKPLAIAVETTSYAMLTQLKLGEVSYSNPIVVWLTKQRNANGGFVSTQDTVIALQALSQYTFQTDVPDLDLQCEVTSAIDRNFYQNFLIQNDNALIQRNSRIPNVFGKLYIDTRGTGIGQLQVEVRYNVPETDLEQCAFDIIVTTTGFRGSRNDQAGSSGRSRVGRRADNGPRSNDISINVCTRYLKAGRTGMSIIDVGLFTGFVPLEKDLKNLLNDATVPVQKYELTARSVIFYVDEIPSAEEEKICITFRAKQEYQVGKVQPVTVRVYDYYSPDNECTKFYHPASGSSLLRTLCVGEVCICAEGKCGKPSDKYPGSTNEMIQIACDEADYVFDITVNNTEKDGSFDVITAVVDHNIKPGLDLVLPGEERRFWKSADCPDPNFVIGERYFVMGLDGLASVDKNGVQSLKYVIDDKSRVMWYPSVRKKNRIKQKLRDFAERLSEEGCPSK